MIQNEKISNDLVSIIVPIYNIESYIAQCIGSIINQTYKNIEIVLVNDGSTDKSGEICDLYANMDKRIHVIHTQNDGLIVARKRGVEYANGDYILFIDGDDWIDENMVSSLLNYAILNNVDIVTSGCIREYRNSSAEYFDSVREGEYITREEMAYLYKNIIFFENTTEWGILPFIVTKLIRSDIAHEVYLDIPMEIKMGEDMAGTLPCLVRAHRIFVIHKAFYHYRQREDSINHSSDMNYYKKINNLYLFLLKTIKGSICEAVLKKQIDAYLVFMLIRGVNYHFDLLDEVKLPTYLLPQIDFPKDCRIVLYGAGRVGESYYRQIIRNQDVSLIAWVDQKYENYAQWDVKNPNILKNIEFDIIIIAVKYRDLSEKIKKELIEKYGCEEFKIMWEKPKDFLLSYMNF